MTGPWWVVEYIHDLPVRAIGRPHDCEGAAILARIAIWP